MITRFFSKHADTIRRWLTYRHLPVILACVGIVLTLPALGGGLIIDDYFHRDMLSGPFLWPPARDASLFGMFSFLDGTPEGSQALKEAGIIPWWTFEGIKVAFWRPMTEITHWLDYHLWADIPWLMHAHSLLWFGAAIWVITKLYRRIIGPVWVAGLAGLLFAIDNTHAVAAGFLAQRNTLIAAFFGGLALLAHVRRSQDGWRPGAVLGPLCYMIGVLSKESALAIGAYLFAYTLFLDRNSVRRRVTGFLPYVVLTFGWYFVYHHLGFGVQGTADFYIDPGRNPLLFVKALFVRIPTLLLGQFTGPPADLWTAVYLFLPYGKVIMGCVAAVVLALIGFCMFPLFRRDAVIRFWVVGAFLGLVPMCAAFPSSRLLFFAGIGGMGIIARFLASWVEQPTWLPDRQAWKRSTRVLCLIFVVVHLMLAPLTLPLYTTVLGVGHYLMRQGAISAPYDEDIPQKTVVFVNSPIEFEGAFISQVRLAHGYPAPARAWPLASGLLPLPIIRIDEHTVDIECKRGLLPPILNHVLRGSSHPMRVGQRIALSGMSVEVLALADDNWQPSRARFTFSVPLDDPSLLLLQWKKGKLIPYTPPAVGESEMLLTELSKNFM